MVSVMLVPWTRTFRGFTLVVCAVQDPGNYNIRKPKNLKFEDLIEIRTAKGMRIAAALASAYAKKIHPATFNVYKSERIAIKAEMSREDAERFLKIMKYISRFSSSRMIPDDLIEKPTFENVERFLAINALVC